MKRQEALALLDLDNARCTLTEEIVREAFKTSVWKHHPDSQGQTVGPVTIKLIDEIKQARDYLLKNLDGLSDSACALCQGRGIVKQGMGWLPCVACKGTGDRR